MINLAIIVIGFTAMAAQVLFMREFLVSFYGNELSLGFVLFNWLVATAVGSFVLGSLASRIKNKFLIFSLCQFAISILLFLNIFEIRLIKNFFHLAPGAIISFPQVFLSSFLILFVTCSILGFCFSLASRITNAGKAYILEAIGSCVGGFLVSIILIQVLNSFQIVAILSLVNLISAAFLSVKCESKKLTPLVLLGSLILLIAVVCGFIFGNWNYFERYSLEKQWQKFHVLDAQSSVYGKITVIKNGGQVSFFNNGMQMYSLPDKQNAEEAVHYCLLEHAHPQSVLLAGLSLESAQEALKEPIQRLDYLELDPLLITMAKENLADNYRQVFQDKRLAVINSDARGFIKNTHNKYDCVIINLGDPLTAQINRYYTQEFFLEVKRILNSGGIICFSLSSSENFIPKELAKFLRTIYATLNSVFPEVKVIPGNTAYFLASSQKGALTYDYKILIQRKNARNLKLDFVADYYLFSKLSVPRIGYIEEILHQDKFPQINSDIRPIAYHYAVIFWLSRFRDNLFNKILMQVDAQKVRLAVLLVFFFLLYWFFTWGKNNLCLASLLGIGIAGFSGMSFQLIILLAFQCIYGILFYKIGIILTCFMLGLSLGAIYASVLVRQDKRLMTHFSRMQAVLLLFSLALPFIFKGLLLWKGVNLVWLSINLVFPLLSVACGFITGFQFPLANKICLNSKPEAAKIAGVVYAIDLIGSCLGVLASTIFLIPILGIAEASFMIGLLNFGVLLILVKQRGEK